MAEALALDTPASQIGGMNFALSDEQQAIRKMVREFAESEIAPARHGVGRGPGLPARGRSRSSASSGCSASSSPRSTAAPASRYIDYIGVIEELSRVDGSVGHLRRRAQQPLHEPHLHVRHARSRSGAGSRRSRRGS